MEPVIGAKYRLVLGSVHFTAERVTEEKVVLEGPQFGNGGKVRVVKHVPLAVFREKWVRVAG